MRNRWFCWCGGWSVVSQYPKAAGKRREEVADELMALEDEGKLSIEFDTVEF